MTIRTVERSDADALANLWTAAHLAFDPALVATELESLVGLGDRLALVDDQDGVIVGSILGTFDGRRGWVNRLATHPKYEGQGRATALLAEFENRLVGLGCRKVNLLVEPDNAAVVGFYRKRDFTPKNLIFMEKWLPSEASAPLA